jgi:SEC-C motif domain protein
LSQKAASQLKIIGSRMKAPISLTSAACPCSEPTGSPPQRALPLSACCGRYHAGPEHLKAPTAEALMRSRYSAYVLGLTDYLLATWHPSTRPTSMGNDAMDADTPSLTWLGLQVRSFEIQDATHATVDFVARSKQGGRAQRMQEKSRFIFESGFWFYVDGDVLEK